MALQLLSGLAGYTDAYKRLTFADYETCNYPPRRQEDGGEPGSGSCAQQGVKDDPCRRPVFTSGARAGCFELRVPRLPINFDHLFQRNTI